MSGNVAPSSTDCGRMSSAASSHFTAAAPGSEPSAGRIESYAASVVATNTGWKTSAASPITASTIA